MNDILNVFNHSIHNFKRIISLRSSLIYLFLIYLFYGLRFYCNRWELLTSLIKKRLDQALLLYVD